MIKRTIQYLNIFIVSVIVPFGVTHAGSFTGTLPEKSAAAIEFGFDIMETFDDLEDWSGETGTSGVELARRTTGGHTTMNTWIQDNVTPAQGWSNYDDYYWIQDHSDHGGQIWDPNGTGSGKSVSMEMGRWGRTSVSYGADNQCRGPHKFGINFANGDRGTGYRDEMYVFFMIYIPINYFPTSTSGGIGAWQSGTNYMPIQGSKFFMTGIGFESPWHHPDDDAYGGIASASSFSTYGWYPILNHMGGSSTTTDQIGQSLGDQDYLDQTNPYNATYAAQHQDKVDNPFGANTFPAGQWVGLEVRYKLKPGTNSDEEFQMWWYNTDGTATELYEKTTLHLRAEVHDDDAMNQFTIGGNNSEAYNWGNTMNPRYYIDDFIVNGSRIGPTYFEKKLNFGATELPFPSSPKSVKIQQ